ncbi:hypothetical protein SAMN05216499_10131 [Actinacidiphila paucisporea]|uniref:Uncharacterized protein n=1 Tax=Actinacidiphila paucisporea TaxID=310782 RepID=A0A1M6TFL5_9ACTN|nr:hypothetical protein SAMN05216499_10131 [Actinacidiphila paucisporea]
MRDPAALFDLPDAAPEPTPGALPFSSTDPAGCNAALVGDGYAWLGRLLPAPPALPCPRCRRPMRLGDVPLLWECAPCDARDVRRNAA